MVKVSFINVQSYAGGCANVLSSAVRCVNSRVREGLKL